jgi:DNA-binding CsgD family transcriptional regulator
MFMVSNLTQREREVYGLVVMGKSDKEIAAQLGMTVRTARFHVSNILAKTRTANRLQLVWAAANIIRQSVHNSKSLPKHIGG